MKVPTSFALACCLLAASTAPAAAIRNDGPRFAETLDSLLAKGDFAGMESALGEPLLEAGAAGLQRGEVQAGLARYEFIRLCGVDALAELSKAEGGSSFLKAFLADPQWLDSFLISDPPKLSHAQAAKNLCLLHQHGKDFDVPLYRRLATAMALTAGKMNAYLLVERFGQIQRAHRDGLLHASFDNLSVREMRWAIYLGGNAADYEYLLNDRQTPLRAYLGACWAVSYRLKNDYGDSIQGPLYYPPFRHALSGSATARSVGGVCGALSTYAASVARAHGVPSEPVGQPGHCAFMVRVGDEFPLANNASWPTFASSPGWEGTGYATLTRLYEPVSKDVPRLLATTRATWLARLQIEKSRPPAEWLATFERAIAAQPLNYDVWLEAAKAIAAEPKVDAAVRLDFARRASKNFAAYPEAAWALVERFTGKILAGLSNGDRVAFLLERHSELREQNANRYVDWPFEAVLDWQANLFGRDADAIAYFGKLLEIHSSEAPYRHVFSRTLAWGLKRFGTNPKTSALLTQTIEAFFRSGGDAAERATMRDKIIADLRVSARTNDLGSFALLTELSSKLLPELRPEDVHLNAKQRAAFPAIDAFPGEVLSEKGMLKTSGTDRYDRPLSYPAILRTGGFGGYLDTAPQETPSATVQLPGEGKLSGIVIVDRYETSGEAEWSLPLKVSYSSDGKSWTEAGTFTKAEPVYRVDLAGKEATAKFVKVERLPGKKERFHLRNILVFGQPLY